MPIAVTCECGRRFEIPAGKVGLQVDCPECGRETVVPGRSRRFTLIELIVVLCICTALVALIMPATRSAREAARRAQCVNNLKQIGLALHNYHDANGCLPPAAITDKDGKPLLSWRVAILPYYDNSALYAKFHLDEPWDSPNNRPLVEAMPSVFACPSDRTPRPGTTGYQVVVGPATAFTPDFKPVTFSDVTDGLEKTLFVGESRHSVLWSKPEDLSTDRAEPLHGLAGDHGFHVNGFNVLFGDGSVWFLKKSIAPGVVDALLTRDGKEEIPPGSY